MSQCCEQHAHRLPDGCRQGRDCPARVRTQDGGEQVNTLGGGNFWPREVADPLPTADQAMRWTLRFVVSVIALVALAAAVASWDQIMSLADLFAPRMISFASGAI